VCLTQQLLPELNSRHTCQPCATISWSDSNPHSNYLFLITQVNVYSFISLFKAPSTIHCDIYKQPTMSRARDFRYKSNARDLPVQWTAWSMKTHCSRQAGTALINSMRNTSGKRTENSRKPLRTQKAINNNRNVLLWSDTPVSRLVQTFH
jgi:hypothetical protein